MNNFKIVNEDGIEEEAEILTAFSYNDNKYVLYTIDENEENASILVSKLISDQHEQEKVSLVDIDDDIEREKVKKIAEEILDGLKW
mgnify:CR=1 FL=1